MTAHRLWWRDNLKLKKLPQDNDEKKKKHNMETLKAACDWRGFHESCWSRAIRWKKMNFVFLFFLSEEVDKHVHYGQKHTGKYILTSVRYKTVLHYCTARSFKSMWDKTTLSQSQEVIVLLILHLLLNSQTGTFGHNCGGGKPSPRLNSRWHLDFPLLSADIKWLLMYLVNQRRSDLFVTPQYA